MKAIQMFEAKVDTVHAELRKDNVTKEHLADIFPNRQDLLTRLEKLFAANKVLLKAKCQPEAVLAISNSKLCLKCKR